jgi:hypothetical protein
VLSLLLVLLHLQAVAFYDTVMEQGADQPAAVETPSLLPVEGANFDLLSGDDADSGEDDWSYLRESRYYLPLFDAAYLFSEYQPGERPRIPLLMPPLV